MSCKRVPNPKVHFQKNCTSVDLEGISRSLEPVLQSLLYIEFGHFLRFRRQNTREMETSKEGQQIILDRTSRATRGKRLTKLVDEELEDDEMFWNQDALKEEENDENYEEEVEAADVFDSDFDEDEPDPDETVENEPDERNEKRKRLIFPGKSSTKKKKKKKVLEKIETAPDDENTPEQSTPAEHHDVPDDVEVERIVRKSTRTSVIVRQAERDAIRAALQATMKPMIRRKKEGEEKRMTQEEMLLEAAQTEIMNLRNLERVLAREEEVKKRAVVHKAVYSGPQIRYISRDGSSYLEYRNGASFHSEISTTSTPYPEKALCAVTGQLAKFRDPKTGLPYATKEAFKIIRERFSDKNNVGERKNMGILYDSISGQGFSRRQRRSINPKIRQTSYFRSLARFRMVPDTDFETEDSE